MSSEIQELAPQDPHPNFRRLLKDIPEEECLRHIIRTRFVNGMTEDFIAVILRDILEGLNHLHATLQYGYENTNARDIYVSTDQEAIAIGVAFVETRPFVHPGNPWEKGRSETDGMWGLGIIALELAYGSLPSNCTEREQLVSMANNLVRILKLQLDNDDDDDDDDVDDNDDNDDDNDDDDDDDEKETKKAKKKGNKGKLQIADYQKGKEKAKKKEKEDEKLMIKLPELEKLLDHGYVESRVKDRGKKNPMVLLKKKCKKVKKFLSKNDDERKFSRDFLVVVMKLLDKQVYTSVNEILENPFFQQQQLIDRAKFERSMRGED